MTKADIVNEISEKTGIEKIVVQTTVEAFMKSIRTSMTDGKNGRVQVKTDQPLQATPQFLALLGGADVCNGPHTYTHT